MDITLISDLENNLPIRNKLNELASAFCIAKTDEAITAGAVTSIPIAASVVTYGPGYKIVLVDITTGVNYELTLSALLSISDNAISINSYTFPDNVPSGSPIFILMSDFINTVLGTIGI